MITLETTTFINRPQQEVFDFVSNPANDHKWQSNVKSKKWTSEDPHGVGSTQHLVTRNMGRDMEQTAEIFLWDPPNQYKVKVVNGPFPFEGRMKFEPQENGTKVTMGGQAEAGGFFKIMEGLIKRQMESQLVANLEALKLLMEAGSE